MASMKIRKPRGPSERCGVITAEKIFGSAAVACRRRWSLSVIMSGIIRQIWGSGNMAKKTTKQV